MSSSNNLVIILLILLIGVVLYVVLNQEAPAPVAATATIAPSVKTTTPIQELKLNIIPPSESPSFIPPSAPYEPPSVPYEPPSVPYEPPSAPYVPPSISNLPSYKYVEGYTFVPGIDNNGSDLQNCKVFPDYTIDSHPNVCKEICDNDPRCKAYNDKRALNADGTDGSFCCNKSAFDTDIMKIPSINLYIKDIYEPRNNPKLTSVAIF